MKQGYIKQKWNSQNKKIAVNQRNGLLGLQYLKKEIILCFTLINVLSLAYFISGFNRVYLMAVLNDLNDLNWFANMITFKPCLRCYDIITFILIPKTCLYCASLFHYLQHLLQNFNSIDGISSEAPAMDLFKVFIESPLKMIKNAFYSILKAFFVLKIFKFLYRIFSHVKRTAWLQR